MHPACTLTCQPCLFIFACHSCHNLSSLILTKIEAVIQQGKYIFFLKQNRNYNVPFPTNFLHVAGYFFIIPVSRRVATLTIRYVVPFSSLSGN